MVAPIIMISGRVISGRPLRGAARAAVSSVRIAWGRETIFDRPRPGVATVKIVNYGLNPDPPRKGEPLIIRHPNKGVLFRGKVVEAPTTGTRTVRLANGLREEITITTVTAHDALAAFAQFVPTGPSVGTVAPEIPGTKLGVGSWDTSAASTRIAAIRTAGAGRYVPNWTFDNSTVQPSPAVTAWAPAMPVSDASALDLLHEAISFYDPLVTLSYDPAAERATVMRQQPATSAAVTLTAAGSALSVTLTAGTVRLPSGRIAVDSIDLKAPADDVAEVRIEYTYWETVFQDMPDGSRIAKSVSYPAAAASLPVPGADSGSTYVSPFRAYCVSPGRTSTDARDLYPAWWLGKAAERFAALNGIRALPLLIIDPEDDTLSAIAEPGAAVPLGWRTYQSASSYYLAGSMFSGEGAPSVVQFIGGTLTYDDRGRWRHVLTAGPTAAGAGIPLTLDQMFPASATDALDGWAADLTINDLAAATRRA